MDLICHGLMPFYVLMPQFCLSRNSLKPNTDRILERNGILIQQVSPHLRIHDNLVYAFVYWLWNHKSHAKFKILISTNPRFLH